MPEAEKQRPRIGQLFARLEEILRELDRDDVELEDQMALYREACEHVVTARGILGETSAELEVLSSTLESADPRG